MNREIMQKQIIDIIDEIKQGEITYVSEMTDTLLYNLFCVYNNDITYDETMEYVSLLYRLIFQTHKHQPEIAYHIISGFMRFGQSVDGQNYKPMLDHYIMEAFDHLVKTNGWSILKNFVNTLRYNLEKVENETVFNYILLHISAQLAKDNEDAEAVTSEAEACDKQISDLCYNLPREKSFTWGWFSYYIARIYCSRQNVDANNALITPKKMRNYLMIYRRLLTKLRSCCLHELPVSEARANVSVSESNSNVWEDEEIKWELVLYILNRTEYRWADNLIKTTTTNDKRACELAAACEAAAACELAAAACETVASEAVACEVTTACKLAATCELAAAVACETATACEAVACKATTACKLAAALEKTVDSTYEVVALETGVVADVPAAPAAVEEKKTGNSSWFYSLLGWS